jgi:hypothetical protein
VAKGQIVRGPETWPDPPTAPPLPPEGVGAVQPHLGDTFQPLLTALRTRALPRSRPGHTMLPHIGGAATERTRGKKANRALEYTRGIDPAVLADLRQAKAVSLTGLSKQHRTARFRRFVNSASLDRFLLVRDARTAASPRPRIGQPLAAGADPYMARLPACVSQECQAYIDLKFGDGKTANADSDDEEATSPRGGQRDSEGLQARMKGMAQAYAFILMKEGHNYQQIHNEKIFFEALYDFTVRVTNQRFGPRVW